MCVYSGGGGVVAIAPNPPPNRFRNKQCKDDSTLFSRFIYDFSYLFYDVELQNKKLITLFKKTFKLYFNQTGLVLPEIDMINVKKYGVPTL